MRRLSLRPAVPIVAALAAFTAAVPVASAADRFALSGGCDDLQRAADGTASTAGRTLRLQATDLGSYLLVTTEGSFRSASGAEVTAAAAPSACRRLGSCVRTATISSSAPGPTRRRRFGSPRTGLSASARPAPTAVCGSRRRMAASPTRSPATGRPVARGPTRFRSARSADGWTCHLHWMNFEMFGGAFKCGRPWHPYGIAHALPDCSGVPGSRRRGGAGVQNPRLTTRRSSRPTTSTGWPTLASLGPAPRSQLRTRGPYWRLDPAGRG